MSKTELARSGGFTRGSEGSVDTRGQGCQILSPGLTAQVAHVSLWE